MSLPRSPLWDDVETVCELHERRIPIGEQVEMLGVDRSTLKRIRASQGLSYGRSGSCCSIPAAPLLNLVASRSLSYGSERAMLLSVASGRGVSFDALDRAIKRAKATGRVTERTAERLAVYLGRRVEDLWERKAS